MTPAMYFGIGYTVTRVNDDKDLAGLAVESFRAFRARRAPDQVHPDLRINGRL